MEVGAESASREQIADGETLTLSLPMRGHVQVRVTGLEARRVVLLTLAGHPLVGAVRFLCEQRGDVVRFEVELYERAASVIDLIAMRTLGDRLQNHTWSRVVENMIARSGGNATAGVESDSNTLNAEEAARIAEWHEELVLQRKREENAETIGMAGRP